jgi:hypothetical protein
MPGAHGGAPSSPLAVSVYTGRYTPNGAPDRRTKEWKAYVAVYPDSAMWRFEEMPGAAEESVSGSFAEMSRQERNAAFSQHPSQIKKQPKTFAEMKPRERNAAFAKHPSQIKKTPSTINAHQEEERGYAHQEEEVNYADAVAVIRKVLQGHPMLDPTHARLLAALVEADHSDTEDMEDTLGVEPVQSAAETVPEVQATDIEPPVFSASGDEDSDMDDDNDDTVTKQGKYQGVTYTFIGTKSHMMVWNIPRKKGTASREVGDYNGLDEEIIFIDEYQTVHDQTITDEEQEDVIWL